MGSDRYKKMRVCVYKQAAYLCIHLTSKEFQCLHPLYSEHPPVSASKPMAGTSDSDLRGT